MTHRSEYDGVIVGSGPNGLAAAIVLARAGLSVLVIEALEQIGGGTRSDELTLPGFTHDVCSAVHPMAVASPFFRTLPLHDHGLEWVYPQYALAHPFDDGSAAVLEHSLEKTCQSLGVDENSYKRLVGPLVANWPILEQYVLGPIGLPRHPLVMAGFGMHAIQPASRLAKSSFKSEPARALFAGLAAHALMPLESWGTSAVGLVLGALAHVGGWPIARGGSQRIADALAAYLRSLGGEIVAGVRVRSLKELPPSRVVLCDLSPRGLLQIAGERFPASDRRALERYRYGPGVFKVDWALRGPIPWTARQCARAGTVHLGGTLSEIARSERDSCSTGHSEHPFVLLAQPSLIDPSRAPEGCHTAWAYCHVPGGSALDMTSFIEAQVERFAPGFRDLISARSTKSPAQLEAENSNLVGGNITGGANSLLQLFLRPTSRLYETPIYGLFLCSASTPPGAGVHGMCGYHAAMQALDILHLT
ncbi:MAG: NAD(P)/FAD-dependent oxidoreductase [Candidatus Acidiferrum sp.]